MRCLPPAAVLLSLSPLATAQIDWSLARIPTPHTSDLAHDPRRGTSVLFDDGETWELDAVWLRRDPPTSPPSRSQHATAYDRARGVVTLFGGYGTNWLQDTWDWDGRTWTLRAIGGPPARSDAALAWDPVTARLLLFGGGGSAGALGDTWHFDGSNWTQLQPALAPAARTGHAVATDLARGRVVLFGGAATGALGDTWEWNGANWSVRTPVNSPVARTGHRLGYDEARQRVRLFGGGSIAGNLLTPLADTWEWNGTTWTQVPATGPDARLRTGVCWDTQRQALIAFGGHGDRSYADTWALRGNSWTRESAGGPGRPLWPVGCFDAGRGRVVVWSSAPAVDGPRLFEWDGRSWSEFGPANQPGSRAYAAFAYDAARQRCVLFGGFDIIGGMFNETWEWDGQLWTQRVTAAAPSPRWAHALAYDSARQRIVLFGGYTSFTGAVSGETWEYDGQSWQQRVPATPAFPRARQALAYDPIRQRTVMFGGTATAPLGDTWTWDGSNWTPSPAIGPSARWSPAMAFDAASGRVLLHGGRTLQASYHDLWEFDGQGWQQRATATSTPDLAEHSLVPDGTGALLLLFGERRDGLTTSFSDQVWRLGPTVPASSTPAGSSCGGMTLPRLLVTEPALLTRLVRFDVDGTAPQVPTLLVLSDGFGTTPLGGGCTQYVQGTFAATFLLADASGLATVRLVLPGAGLRGLQFTAQAAALDPLSPFGGAALTAAVRLVVGD